MKPAIMNSSKTSSGFTLIELMVTIVVLAVIVSIAAPNISNQLANSRVKSTTATLENVLKEARAESSIRRIPVRVSYVNGSQPNNTINIEVPYSGPFARLLLNRSEDWTSIFFKSAVALDWPGNKNPGQGGGNQGGDDQGDDDQGGNDQGGDNQGGSDQGGSDQGGSDQGGSDQGGSDQGGSDQGGSDQGGSDQGSGDQGSGDQGGGDQGGGDQGSGDQGSDDQNVTFVSVETYNFDKNSIIKSNPATVTFKPQKRVDAAIVFTICDKNTSVTPRQVMVSKLGNISSRTGGSCS